MKKTSLILVIVAAINIKSYSQIENRPAEKPKPSKCIKEGDFIIDGYWGYPYFWGALLQNALADSAKSYGLSIHNTNHIGGRFEYMISDKIGIGMEYTYANLGVNYTGTNSLGNPQIYTIGLTKQRLLGKVNLHFATGPKLDPYATFGVGYSALNVYANEPGANVSSVNSALATISLPIAIRAGMGLRYFFTENFGLNAEFGLGGPLLQAGVTVKI